jgi:short-subunit dehydrogenase
MASHVLPGMVANGRGDLVVMSSAAAAQAIPFMSTYAATKAFEMRFVRGLDQELRGTGVRAFAICPGPVRTAFHRLGWGKDLPRLMPTETAGSVAARVVRVLDRRRRNPVVASGPLAPITMPLTGLLGEALSAWGAGAYHRPRH